MAKTPPLVIPVVVDASGVNSGLNNINRRLSGVRGNAGSDNGNFGTGGGAATAAVVGALAARRAANLTSTGYGFSYAANAQLAKQAPGTIQAFNRSTPFGWLLQSRADALRERAKEIHRGAPSQAQINVMENMTRNRRPGALSADAKWRMMDLIERSRTRRAEAMALGNKLWKKSARYAGYATAVSSIPGSIGRGIGMAAGALGSLGTGLTVGGLAYGALRYGRNLENDNLQELVGSPNYGVLRRAQLREFSRYRGQGTLAQNFMLGAESGWGISEGGGLGNISYGMSYGMNEISKGLGRMASRPISGTIENIIRILTWSATRTAPSTQIGDANSEKFYRWLGME